MTRITEVSERVFLSRAEAVTEKKRTRAAHYKQQLQGLIEELDRVDVLAELQLGDVSKVSMQILEILTKLERTHAEQDAHTQKVNALRAKQHANQAVIPLWVSDANAIAGTDGANFFTKAGKVVPLSKNSLPKPPAKFAFLSDSYPVIP